MKPKEGWIWKPKSGASTNSATRASSRGAWPTAATSASPPPVWLTPNPPLGQALGLVVQNAGF